MLASNFLQDKESILFRYLSLFILSVNIYAGLHNVSVAKLGNGLRMMVLPNHSVPQVWVQVWYNVASKDELDGHTGLSHILEHIMFHGTAENPDYVKNILLSGGLYNAVTSKDYTYYYQIAPKDQLDYILNLEADRMQNLVFNKSKIAKELLAVKEERLLRLGNYPDRLAMEQANSMLHIRGPYHHYPIGWMSDIESANINAIKNWYKSWYVPNNAIVVVGGDIDVNNTYKLINKYFGKLQPRVLPSRVGRPDVPLLGNSSLTVKNKLIAHDSFSISFLVPSLVTASDKQDVYSLLVLCALLNYGENSVLRERFVNSGSAINSYVSYGYLHRFDSDLSIALVFGRGSNISESPLLKVLNKLAEGNFSEQDLERAKAMLLAHHVFAQDSFVNTLKSVANYAVLDLNDKLRVDFPKFIGKVTKKDIMHVLNVYLIKKPYLKLNLLGA